MEETWARIPNYPQYEASSLGRVREGRDILPTGLSPSNYRIVTLRNRDYGPLPMNLAECVAKAHGLPDPGYGWSIWFRDGDKKNCALANLYWRRHDFTAQTAWLKDRRKKAGIASAKAAFLRTKAKPTI